MRLWHYALIPKLPTAQLNGQWRKCLALLGNGWGKRHSTVDYVFKYYESYLVSYTYLVAAEKRKRGHNPNLRLIRRQLEKRLSEKDTTQAIFMATNFKCPMYPEHNDAYYNGCIENLKNKGVEIE